VLKGKAETLGHDTDHGGTLRVGLDPSPDDVGVASVPVLPHPVPQDDDLLSRTRVLRRIEHPPQDRDAIDLGKKIRRDESPLKPLRRGGLVGQIHGSACVTGQPVKRGLLVAPINEIQNRDALAPGSLGWIVLSERGEGSAAIEVETPQNRPVHNAERVGGESDAEGDGQDGHHGEPGCPDQHAHAIPQISHEGIHGWILRALYLDHPKEKILDPGGAILMALYDGEAVGTVALVSMGSGSYELAKMAVEEHARGKGIGWRLGSALLDRVRDLGGTRVYLESNTILEPAINLYRKLGFETVQGGASPYDRCNIQMEVWLGDSSGVETARRATS